MGNRLPLPNPSPQLLIWKLPFSHTSPLTGDPHPVALQVSHLDLQQREVSQDLQVVLVPLQSVAVTLDGFVILLVRALQ